MLSEEERAVLTAMATAPEVDEPVDDNAELLAAFERVIEAIGKIKLVESKSDSGKVIATAFTPLLIGVVDGLKALAVNVAKIKAPDLSPICEAVNELTKSQNQIIRALTAPRELIFDDDGAPIGLKSMRPN